MASLSPQHKAGCARVGIARLNAFRLNVYEPILTVITDGSGNPATGPGTGLLIEGASIQQVLNDQTDTASFRARGWVPRTGQRLDVYLGEQSINGQIFGGRILESTARYLAKPVNVVHDIHCVDPTWLLSRRKVLAVYTAQSATSVIADLVTRFTRGISANHVEASLPTIDAITFTNESVVACLTAICQQIGAYWFLDYASDLHVFTVADQPATPITDASPGPSSDHTRSEDLSQVATRIIGLGGGVSASVDLAAGSTELPLDLGNAPQVAWYPSTGGIVQTGAQRLTYTAVKGDSGRGAILGAGNAPTSAPLMSPAAGTGLVPGLYHWGITYKTALGETMIGPAAPFQTGVSAPTLAQTSTRPSYYYGGTSYYTPNTNINFRIAVLYTGGGFSFGPATGANNFGDKTPEIYLGLPKVDPITGFEYPDGILNRAVAKIVQIQIYRTMPNGSIFYAAGLSVNGVPSPPGGWHVLWGQTLESDLPTQQQYPTGPVATFNAVTVTLPISGSSSVTGRGLFRTKVNEFNMLRLVDIANNTTTTYVDTAADSALGAAPPTVDTSQLREDGQVAAGATEMLLTAMAPFVDDGGATGGWVTVGNMTVRYSGISGSKLTGIPASGPGSVTATVRYGTQVLVQPRLVGIPGSGVGAMLQPVRKGDQVTLRLELQDAAAALALANKLGSGDANDGLVEFVVNDSRFGAVELLAHMRAVLAERKDPRIVVTYATRDPSHEVGRLVTITLTTPPISGTFRIQRVAFSEIAVTGGVSLLQPKRTIEATNKLYTFADLLRRLRGREGGVP